MGKIKGWKKVIDTKRGSTWINEKKNVEVNVRKQSNRDVWRINTINSKTGRWLTSTLSYFTEYKTRQDAEKVAVKFMRLNQNRGAKTPSKMLSQSEKKELIRKLYPIFRLDNMTQPYQNRVINIFEMVEHGEIVSVEDAKRYYNSLKPIQKTRIKRID